MLSARVPTVSGRASPYLRSGIVPPSAPYIALGTALTLLAAYASRNGGLLGFGLLLALLALMLLLVGFMAYPHIAVAFTIPFFTLLPMLKALVSPKLGPTKDIMIAAAAIAAGAAVIQRRRSSVSHPVDQVTLVVVLLFMGLYFIDIGSGISGSNRFGLEWFHGVRLVWEPLLLLLYGLVAREPRRTIRWALGALVAAALIAAIYGLIQQVIGPDRLVFSLGYSFTYQVRTLSGHLRSFGTLDQAFDYAAVLAFGLTAVVLWLRRGTWRAAAGVVLLAGLAVSLVRGAALSIAALLALILARSGRVATAVLLLCALVAAAVVFVIAATRPTPGRVVQAGPSIYLTLNGRTKSWREAVGKPGSWAFGRGVGLYGTAAQRATRSAFAASSAGASIAAVDSGYLATISDVGFVGLIVLLTLFGRALVLFRRATARGDRFGWVGTGFVVVMVLDATLRSSFTGFPTADIAFLLIGLGLAAVTAAPSPAPAREPRRPGERPVRQM